ncbi:MAG: nitroreductase family protein, partial [Thermostichus sp. BF3_bins_97]
REPQRKARLAELAGGQAHIRQCPLFLVWLADLARLSQLGETQGLPSAGLDYLEMFLVASIDAALAAQNAVIAAEGMGLGTVYIGAMRNQPEAVARELALPSLTFAVFGLCVGYAAQAAAIKPRLPQRAVVHAEQYQLEAQTEAIVEYNQVMRAFYRAQNMKVEGDWAEHSLRRVAGPDSLSGRNQLRQALHHLGFKLL